MKRIIAMLLAVAMCFCLCACGEKSAKIDELKALISESPYSCEEGEYINVELVERYQTIVKELNELGVTVEDCPELEYAEAVAGLSQYFDYLPLIKAGMATTGPVGEARTIVSDAMNQYKIDQDGAAFRDAVTYTAKELLDEAGAAAAEYNTNDEVQELIDCLEVFANAAYNFGAAVCWQPALVSIYGEGYIECGDEYSAILMNVLNYMAEIGSAEEEITAIYEELGLSSAE